MLTRTSVTTTAVAALLSSTLAVTDGRPASPATGTTTPVAGSQAAPRNLTGIPVYWIGETASSFRLYREFRTVRDTGGRVASAVSAMLAMTPLDPDYQTPWRPATVKVTQTGTALTVDLSRSAISHRNVGSELAARAVQQLVYTATAATVGTKRPASTVRILIDGKPADAWGAVRLGSRMKRAPMVQVLSHAWIIAPQQGERRRPGTVRFTGYGTSFEATFHWKVTTTAGTLVARGYAVGGDGTGGFGTVRFSTRLAPGRYVVQLETDDPSDAEGPGPMRDTKQFVVR